MVHLSTDVRANVFGEWVITQWTGIFLTNPLPDVHSMLDRAPFIYMLLKRQYQITLFPFVDTQDDPFITTGWLVPPLGHTPDFSLERIMLGEDFLRDNVHSINPGPMEITLHAENDRLVWKWYQLRHRMHV